MRPTWGKSQSDDSKTFSGFRSQWTMFFECRCLRATRIWVTRNRVIRSDSRPISLDRIISNISPTINQLGVTKLWVKICTCRTTTRILSNYIYNPLCQKYPRHFVRIFWWFGAIQIKTCFVTFVTKLKMEDHMFPFFPFVSSPWRNCHKIEGHHSIENIAFKYPYFCNIFLRL